MPIDLYPSVAKVKRNGAYQNLPGFAPEAGDNSAQAMIANAETSTTAQYAHPKDSYFRLNNTLYQADADIPVNGTIAVGTNCHVAVLGNDVYELYGEIASQNEDIDALYNYVTPEMFGAKGDGLTDDTDAVQSAINSDKPVLLISLYAISDVINLKNGTRLHGNKKGNGLLQTDATKDIIVCDRSYQVAWSDIDVDYLTLKWSSLPDTGTAGIRLIQTSETKDGWGTFKSKFTRITIIDPYYGLFIDENEPVWQCKFELTISRAQKSAIVYNNGFGNEFDLLAIGASNNVNVNRDKCFICKGGAICNLIDIEDWEKVVLDMQGAFSPVVINRIHLERCTITQNYAAFISIASTPVIINSILLYNCKAESTERNYVVSTYGTSASDSCCVIINNIIVRSLTKAGQFDLLNPQGTASNYIAITTACGGGWNNIFTPYPQSTIKPSCFYRGTTAYPT